MTEGWLSQRGSRLANVTIDALTMVSFLALLGTLIQAAFAAGDAYRRHQMATDFLNARAQLLREAPRRRPSVVSVTDDRSRRWREGPRRRTCVGT